MKIFKKYLLYWFVSWSVLFLGAYILTLDGITPDGKYVVETPCLREYHDQDDIICLEYGEPKNIPLADKLKTHLIYTSVFAIFLAYLVNGYIEDKRKKEVGRYS